jgi:alanyl-tRNA synthetase
MTAQEIRNKYLDFFSKRGHAQIPRALLVPYNDPTTLFTGSGMQPLIQYLLGEPHPEGTKLVDSQTCLRAQDIDEVGDNRHTTFFEMLGNWSLGDYFKAEQLPWFFEFLTDVVGLDPNKLYVTAFIGDKDNGIPRDTESAELWAGLFKQKGIEAKAVEIGSEADGYAKGMQGGRIFYYDASKNWWCRAGKIGDMPAGEPGGPDSEVFYEFDFVEHDPKWGQNCHPNCDCGRYMEIGNSVFMEYLRTEKGFEKLPKQNVDFGAGLERIAAAAINSPDMFKISVIWPIVEKLEAISGVKYDFTPGDLGYEKMPDCWLDTMKSMRVIADHLRAATFLAVDGVSPSNKEQGYVMRRLLRRAIRFAFDLGIEQNFLEQIVPVIADIYHADFPELAANRQQVIETLAKEEKVFRQTLRKGLKEFEKIFQSSQESGVMSQGEALFRLYDTYGFPIELSVEEASKRGIELESDWREQFDGKMAEQKARSQTASKGVFKGGLGGQTMQHFQDQKSQESKEGRY